MTRALPWFSVKGGMRKRACRGGQGSNGQMRQHTHTPRGPSCPRTAGSDVPLAALQHPMTQPRSLHRGDPDVPRATTQAPTGGRALHGTAHTVPPVGLYIRGAKGQMRWHKRSIASSELAKTLHTTVPTHPPIHPPTHPCKHTHRKSNSPWYVSVWEQNNIQKCG